MYAGTKGAIIAWTREVGIELAKETECVLVRVANTGPGIPPADRGRTFERFYRGDKSRSGRVDGVGLGLSISREIVRAHGGELTLESNDENLTRFAVKLPVPA